MTTVLGKRSSRAQGGHGKRHKDGSDYEAVMAVSSAMDARTSRYQVQVAAQTGATGLYVVVGYTDKSMSKACTHLVNPWIALIAGLHKNKSLPNFLDKKYSKCHMRGKPNIAIQETLQTLQKIRNGKCPAKETSAELTELWNTYGERFALPAGHHVQVVLEHVHAHLYDVVVYVDAFHGNAACSTPRVVVHQDALAHANDAPFRAVLRQAAAAFRRGDQVALDYAKHNRSAMVELEMLHSRKAHDQHEWLPHAPTGPRQRCFLGEADWDECSEGKEPLLRSLVTEDDRVRLQEYGFLVLDMQNRLQGGEYADWCDHAEAAVRELEAAFNYGIFERNGFTDREKYWLSFEDDESKRTAELWQILSEQSACERLMGERFFMNVKRGGEHARTAQGGHSMCTKASGMGLATNTCRGAAQLALGCHEVLISLFQSLYRSPYVFNTHERFRVKYGTNSKASDQYPRHALMPCHSDIIYDFSEPQ